MINDDTRKVKKVVRNNTRKRIKLNKKNTDYINILRVRLASTMSRSDLPLQYTLSKHWVFDHLPSSQILVNGMLASISKVTPVLRIEWDDLRPT